MNLKFDYYHNLEETELYLLNPDGRELFPVVGNNRLLKLRFNDLSELTFECYSTTTLSDGTILNLDYYDYIQTRRKIFVTGIGEFVITNVKETDNGVTKIKEVSCSSGQIVFQDKGVYHEEKVYYFYNPSDPYDNNYDDTDEGSVPSVAGQLYQQLGILQSLSQGLSDPDEPYETWTITFISPNISGLARNFKEGTSTGYEWMVKDVASAFEAVVLFDFYYKTIHIMTPGEVTERANVIYTFSNFMKEVQIEENADDIVTVLNVNGENCNIMNVNPTGTNYICDFSYYMDVQGRWMSSNLKEKLENWAAAVESRRPTYEVGVASLRSAYSTLVSRQDDLQEVSKIYSDLDVAVTKKAIAMVEGAASPYGIVWCETVNTGSRSLTTSSRYYSSPFTSASQITAYRNPPSLAGGSFYFTGDSITGTAEYCYSYVDSGNNQYLYFLDSGTTTASSYCKLEGKAVVDATTYAKSFVLSGFKRYTALEAANSWTPIYDKRIKELNNLIDQAQANVDSYAALLKSISDQCNIINYFSDTPSLLKELGHYWIEGDYTNSNISILEDTTMDDELVLEGELLDTGRVELSKVCQPKLSFSLTSVDCSKSYEFAQQMSELELGKVITVEKEEGVWYYPALLEIEYDLDKTDTFNLTFANALRLDDWGFTYGDLLSESSATTKQVSANWQDIMAYSKDRVEFEPLIKNPLSATLRAAFANMNNQEFNIDDTGILGRKFATNAQDEYEGEQVRLINNMLIFTDDNWDHARAALGKITFTSGGVTSSSYGLIADTLIGSLIIGSELDIHNANNTILLNGSGISIKDSGNNTVFSANNAGMLTLKGSVTATGGYIGGTSGFTISTGKLYSNGHSTLSGTTLTDGTKGGVYIGTDGLSILGPDKVFGLKLNAASSSFEFNGTIYATGGRFNGNGIQVNSSSGNWSTIDSLATQQLVVSNAMQCNNIEANALTLYGNNGLKFKYTQVRDTYLSTAASTTVNFTASYTCTVTSDYIRYTVSATADRVVPEGTFVTVSLQTVVNFGSDYGTATLVKTAQVYIATQTSSGSVIIEDVNRFHTSGTVVSRTVTSTSPTSKSYSRGANYDYYLTVTNTIIPSVNNTWDLGVAARAWRTVYTTEGVSTQSDIRTKKKISYDLSGYDSFFDSLKPVTYELKQDANHKGHIGFIAQDVANALQDNGFKADAMGIVEPGEIYSLNYSEFIALNTREIQKLKIRINDLEREVQILKSGIKGE